MKKKRDLNMWFAHVRSPAKASKGPLGWLLIFCVLFCACSPSQPRTGLRIMAGQRPSTLSPRASLDASSQWLSALLFRGLTRLNADLEPQPDLAASWTTNARGDTWIFDLSSPTRQEQPVSAHQFVRCLENYREGEPKSPLRTLLPNWESARALDSHRLEIRFARPEPYLPQTLAAFRYFVRESAPEQPCSEPQGGERLLGNGVYRVDPWDPAPKNDLHLKSLRAGAPDLEFTFVQDDNTRVLKMLRGEIDATLNGISLSKTRWLQERRSGEFDFLQRPGARVSYLAFNLRDPILGNATVRRAISSAIDRDLIVRTKLNGFATPAGSLLSPFFHESKQSEFRFDRRLAEELLEKAGFPRKSNGLRFRLSYKTTPAREGIETGLILADMLKQIGIQLDLEIVEAAIFFASIRQNAFQLYSSRWLGITDGSILSRSLRSGAAANRPGYSNAEVDRLLDQALSEMDAAKRKALLGLAQEAIARDLPILPLWYWDNTLILRKGIRHGGANSISLNGSFDVFSELKEPLP